MADYIVVPAAQAEAVREALGRLFAQSQGKPYPIPSDPPIPGCETRYYTDPRPAEEGDDVAFGPRDEFLESTLGRTVQLEGDQSALIPSSFTALDEEWFADVPPAAP